MKAAEKNINNQPVDVIVDKTNVTGTMKGVQVPIICIPNMQYKQLIDDLQHIIAGLKTHLSNSTGQALYYNNIRGTTLKDLAYLSDKLVEVYDYEFNQDCKRPPKYS